MSEQVGASLVLAQILSPQQAAPQGRDAADPCLAPGTNSVTGGLAEGMQPADISEESQSAFASLLTELASLEMRNATAPADQLIRVGVQTALPGSGAPDGNRSPDTGNLLPVGGTILPPAEAILPVQAAPTRSLSAATSRAENPVTAPIVVREPSLPGTPGRVDEPGLLQAPGPEALFSDAARPASPGSAPAMTMPAEQPGDARTQQTAIRNSTSDLQGTATTTSLQGDGSEGGDPAEHQDRQDLPRPVNAPANSRSPSIGFSHDATAAGMLTSPQHPGPAVPPATTATGAPAAHPALTLLGAPADWAEPLAERLAAFATRGANTAEVKLHPPSLGALEVRITVTNDQASLWVASANADVRDALQQALPRLDNLLNGLGIELTDSEIADRPAQDSDTGSGGGNRADGDEAAGREGAGDRPTTRLGLVDTWA